VTWVSNGVCRRRFLQLLSAAAAAGAGFSCLPAALAAEARKPAPRFHIVVVDPGHGGIDPGCIGRAGTYEKDIVLSTARDLAGQLEATRRYKVFLSRSGDEFVPLRTRVTRARAHGADLLLSVHADALPESSVRGASVFTLSEKASDKAAAALAERENRADLVAGIDLAQQDPEVSEILFDLARRQTNNLSIRLAQELVIELGHRVRVLSNAHRSAAFVVLKAPDVPSALIEIGCLSNREEERALQTPAYQHNVATALLRSVNDYFDRVLKA